MASKDGATPPSASSDSDSNEAVKVDLSGRGWEILKFIGFEMEVCGSKTARGRFVVSEQSCQPFGVLHGGVTAYIAESIGSIAGTHASKFQKIAGVELNVNHLLPVPVGTEVTVTANPLKLGNRIQVWEVKFETVNMKKLGGSSTTELTLAAIARITLIVGGSKKDSEIPPATVAEISGLKNL